TQSKNHTKVITRHVWADYLDFCETVRHSRDFKTIYGKRKETIERNFETAKEHHGMRYTQLIGKAQVHMEVGLIFAFMNMKKLAKLLWQRGLLKSPYPSICHVFTLFSPFQKPSNVFTVD
ncbi:MAG: transposase, partial [Eubacterium aggregans]